jgi:hypothetical protein
VLAFIVAFLPTLMVEIGFSTVFEPEQQRRPYRVVSLAAIYTGFTRVPVGRRSCALSAWRRRRHPKSPPATGLWLPRTR